VGTLGIEPEEQWPQQAPEASGGGRSRGRVQSEEP
jgi:hypothetical protein